MVEITFLILIAIALIMGAALERLQMKDTRELTYEELEYIDFFLEYSKNITSISLRTPIRISHSLGNLNLHFYIEDGNKVK